MSNKRYYPVLETQLSRGVVLPVSLSVPTGFTLSTNPYPVFGEGNPTGVATGPYFSVQRGATGAVAAGFTGVAGGPTGMTGVILLRTADAYPGIVSAVATITPPEGGGRDLNIRGVKKVQMSDYTWAIAFYVVDKDGAKTDPPVGTSIDLVIVARDGSAAV